MINITLPDGKVLQYAEAVNGTTIASDISKSLSKKAVAISVNGKLADLNQEITEDAEVRIITPVDKEGLEIIRHDTAHVLAQAIKNLFPDAQITIGPVIDNGFYYDVLPKTALSQTDLLNLEKEMHAISSKNLPIVREVWNRIDAIRLFKSMGEDFKAEIISEIPESESITLYRQGEFIDLCRGPHGPSTKFVQHFKLMKLAGAYWRGDSKNVMLQRIYGTAWTTQADLDQYLLMLEEAEKRDHRKLGKDLDLFHIQDEAPGMIFWHHKGWTVYRILENYIREAVSKRGYLEVKTPMILDRTLWEKSGHWEKFRDNMFVVNEENKVMAIKPMSCPCHIEIFKTALHSYRDLPLRISEFGNCTRNESSGSLHGLMRVRAMTQDDGHIFCTEDQIISETQNFCALLIEIYRELGFNEIKVKFSDRPDVRAGSDEVWDKAEQALKDATLASNLHFEINKGEGAFYGPKLEFHLKDSIGREWQCGTFQVDFVLPERLGAHYVAHDGSKRHPAILHRAILGTLERFIGILIEHYAGHFPLWLAPVQTVVLTIVNDPAVESYAKDVLQRLNEGGYRSELDNSSEKINYKVRKHSLLKVPLMVIIGFDEAKNRSIAVREFGSNAQTTYNSIDEFAKYLDNKLQARSGV